jgi:O-antigen/teichoic acid export membrane protein
MSASEMTPADRDTLAASELRPESVPVETVQGSASGNGWLSRWASRLAAFVVGQGLVQALNLATGFFFVRWLTVQDYAAYSLVMGFQGTLGILVELGLAGSITALLAGRTDPIAMGRYVRSARHFRNRFFVILLPIILVLFPVLAHRQGWSWLLTANLVAGTLIALYFQGMASYYSTPLIVHQQLCRYYQTSTLAGAARLVCSFVLQLLALLTAPVAVWINSLATLAQGWLYKRQSAKLAIEPSTADPATNREVLDYIRPLIPSSIFFAFQGQIVIFLISWFGQARNIAEVGALGRIGQLFVMLAAFNGVVIAPLVARLSREMLARRYVQILGGAALVAGGLMSVSLFAPGLLLWILGAKYAHLQAELGWMMLSASVTYITGVMYTMHAARKWVFSWAVWMYIAVVLIVQLCGIAFMDLSTTRGVLHFAAITAIATIAVQVIWAVYGFLFHEENSPAPMTTEIKIP